MKNKTYFFINLINLCIGIICGVLILFYLESSLNYDKYYKNHLQIYRISTNISSGPEHSMKMALASERMGPMLKDECPFVRSSVRFKRLNEVVVKYNDISFEENNFLYTDTSVFEVFKYEFVKGNKEDFSRKKNSIVIVNSLARKYFGNKDPISEIVRINSREYEVVGVIKNLPDNIHLKFDALLSYESNNESWFDVSCYTYLLLNKNASADNLYNIYPNLFDRYMSKQAKALQANVNIIVEPLTDIHFNSDLEWDVDQGNKYYIYIFGITGLFIVLISSVNYINLSTAFSVKRTKEIGLKKVFGAKKKTIRAYFIFESILLSLIAYVFGIIVVWFIVDTGFLNDILNAKLQFRFFEEIDKVIMSLGLALLVGLISGMYPALRLSSIPLLGAISTSYKHERKFILFRKSLIVLQFIISFCVLIGTVIMNKQIQYIHKKDLGFNKENLISIPLANIEQSKINVLKESLLRNPNITTVSSAHWLPNSGLGLGNFDIETESGHDSQLYKWLLVSPDYIETMGMKLVEGAGFTKDFSWDDNSEYIVNETFIRRKGWANGVGKQIKARDFEAWPVGTIVGVLKDFNINSLYNEIEPIVMLLFKSGGYLYIRLNENDVNSTINFIRSECVSIMPQITFKYHFIDELIKQSYSTEISQLKMVKIFSVICFVLSGLGLIALYSYLLTHRTKEISIRKYLGASTKQIIVLLLKDIALLTLIAIIIAIPLSYWLVNLWLNSFTFRINVGSGIYIISSLIIFLFGFVSVLYHALKAAYINPVEALKYE